MKSELIWHSAKEELPEPKGYFGTKCIAVVNNKQIVYLTYCEDTVRGKKVNRWKHNGYINTWNVEYWAYFPEYEDVIKESDNADKN